MWDQINIFHKKLLNVINHNVCNISIFCCIINLTFLVCRLEVIFDPYWLYLLIYWFLKLGYKCVLLFPRCGSCGSPWGMFGLSVKRMAIASSATLILAASLASVPRGHIQHRNMAAGDFTTHIQHWHMQAGTCTVHIQHLHTVVMTSTVNIQHLVAWTGTIRPERGTSIPQIHTSTPQIHTSTPRIHTSTPRINISTPRIHTSTPQIQTRTQAGPSLLTIHPVHQIFCQPTSIKAA